MATKAAYDEIARWYDDWLENTVTAAGDIFFEPTRRLMGDIAGSRICDLACGQGRVARALAAEGADVPPHAHDVREHARGQWSTDRADG